MGIVKSAGKESTLLDVCKHIGEIHLFGYIIKKMNKEELTFISNDSVKQDILKELELSPASVNRYIANLCEYGLLQKLVRGYYKVNRKYIDFLDENKKD